MADAFHSGQDPAGHADAAEEAENRIGPSPQDWGTLGVPGEPGMARLLHVVETGIATLRHVHYAAGASVPAHRHAHPSLVYGVGGPCVDLNASAPLVRRRLTFLPEGHEHALTYMGAAHVLAIEIQPDRLRRACGGRIPGGVVPLPATLYDLVWNAMLDIVGHAPAAAVNASLQALVEGAADYARKPPSPLVIALIDELHVHWKQVPSVARLARKYALSTQYICRIFKQGTGIVLREYGLLLRLDYARGLLWSTDLPIAEVAAAAGFADQSHLTRALAAHSARTPLRLRRTAPCIEIPKLQQMPRRRSVMVHAHRLARRPALPLPVARS
jgi:AraC-like DNA-binding protein